MKVHTRNGAAVVVPHGWLMGGSETEELETTIDRLIDQGQVHIVIDLAETEMVNSTALSVVADCHQRCDERGGRMALCNADRRINMILAVTRLALRFHTYATQEAALESFIEPQPGAPAAAPA
jgi:anti-anti-sigma factor